MMTAMKVHALIIVFCYITITAAEDDDFYPTVVKNIEKIDVSFKWNCSDERKQCVDGRYCGKVLKDLQGTAKLVEEAQKQFCGHYTTKNNRERLQKDDPNGLKVIHEGYTLVCCDSDDVCLPKEPTCSVQGPRPRIHDCGQTNLFYVNHATRTLYHAKEVTYNKLGNFYPLGCDRVKRSADGKLLCTRNNSNSENDKLSSSRRGRLPRTSSYQDRMMTRLDQHGNHRTKREGRRDKRFAGGILAKLGQFPFLATIYYTHLPEREKLFFGCLGSIIHPQIVLTTFTCSIRGTIEQVLSGGYDINNDTSLRRNFSVMNDIRYSLNIKPQLIRVQEVLPHPEARISRYNKTLIYNYNYCLVKLGYVLEFNDFVRPICLPLTDSVEEMSNPYVPKTEAFGIGYGFNSQYLFQSLPRYAVMQLSTPEECRDAYVKYYQVDADLIQSEKYKQFLFCAGGGEGVGPCTLDEGAPLIKQTPCGVFYQIGIAMNSLPESCGSPFRPSLFGRVTAVQSWLETTTMLLFQHKHHRDPANVDWVTKGQCLSDKEKEVYKNFVGDKGR